MKRMRLWWLIAAMLAAPAADADVFEHPQTMAQAQTALRAAMPDLGQVQLLRGRFSQRKFLREISKPLTSAGEFLLLRDQGIWWHVQTPLDSELTLTRDGLMQRAAGVSAPSPRGREQAGAKRAAAMFMALFALDLETLSRSFELFVMQSGKQWQLGLRPRDAALRAGLQQVIVSGSRQVERVALLEAAGDRTEIDLNAVAQPLSSLEPVERQRFAR